MKSRKWLYNFVGWKPQLGYIPLLAVLGIQGQASKWFMQRVGEYAWSLTAAHPWPCRQGLAPLDHLCTCTAHHGLWVWEGSLLAQTQSLKTKRLWRSWILQLFRLRCSLKYYFFFVTSEGVINHSVYQQEGLAGVWGWGRTVFKLASLLEAECGGS